MRTITTAQRNQVAAGTLAIWTRLELQNPDLVRTDVSTALSTPDWYNEATLTESIDQAAQTFTAVLLRDTGSLSLAPLRTDSTINRNAALAYAPWLDVKRMWWESIAVVATGTTPASGDWKEVGTGYIDAIDVQGSPSTITVTGRDLLARVLDHYMHGVDGVTAFPPYSPSGTDSMETVIQQILDDELGTGRTNVGSSGITLYTPVSPSYVMEPYTTGVGGLMDALTKVAQLAGMVLRYRYDASDVSRLTLLKPPRTATVADWTIGKDEYSVIPVNKLDVTGVRTVIDLFYIDPSTGQQHVTSPAALTGTLTATAGAATFSTSQAGVIANGALILVAGKKCTVSAFNGTTGCTLSGTPTFAASPWTTSASLTKYGELYMKVDLSGSLPMTAANAQAMADAIRSDLETPWLEQQFTSYALWFAQLYDYAKTLANGVQYNADQLGGVTSITHRLKGGTVKTDIGARGQPAGGYRLWLQTGLASAAAQTGPNLIVTPTAGGSTYSIAWSGDNVQLSINGAAYGTPPSSPITVTRPASGSADTVYAFQGTLNGQTVTDSVTIPAIGAAAGTVTPDLTVTPGTQTSTTQPFTVSATNPSGGAAPVITVTLHGTTGTDTTTSTAIAADTATTIASGDVITVTRAAFNSAPASATFRAAMTGGGAETIQRTILNQDKLAFGPNLSVKLTPGTTSDVITWSGDSVQVSIDGAAYAAPAASPITVARNAPGGANKVYSFTGLKDSQTVSNTVVVTAQSGSTAPSATLTPSLTNNQLDDTTSPVTLTASASNLPAAYTWAIYAGYSKGQYSATASWSGSNSSSPLTQTESVTPSVKNSKWFKLVVTVGSDTYVAESQVQGRLSFITTAGTPDRGYAWSDGGYAAGASDAAGNYLASTINVSTGVAANLMFAKGLPGDPNSLGSVPDDATYSKTIASRVSSGKPLIDFAEGIHLNKTIDNVADGAARFAAPVPNATSDVTLVASAGIALGGNNAVKTTAAGWDQQVYSKDGYTGGAWASTIATAPSGQDAVFGLNRDPLTSANRDSLDYAFGTYQPTMTIAAWESGVSTALGSYAVGDALAVTYDGSNIRYFQNGIRLRTVAVGPGLTFFFDSSFYPTGATLNNIRFGPMSSNNADDVGGGVANRITSFNEADGGGLGYSALDSNARLASQRRNVMTTMGGLISQAFVPTTATPVTNPLSSSSLTITVAAMDIYVGSGSKLAYGGGTVTAEGIGVNYVYLYDPTYTGAGTLYAKWDPRNLVNADGVYYVGKITVVSGSGGTGGGYCVAPSTPVLLADGTERTAGLLRVGDLIDTEHDGTFARGFYAIRATSTHYSERWRLVLTDGRELIASPGHRVYVEGRAWLALDKLVAGDVVVGSEPGTVRTCDPHDHGPVVRLTVDTAETYMSNGLLSHNAKAL